MNSQTVLCHIQAGVGKVTLNSPDTMNALDAGVVEGLKSTFNELGANQSVRAVVVTGTGKAFCAGGDLKLMRRGLNAIAGREYILDVQQVVLALIRLDKPVIAAVNGYAVGAGFSLALASDIVLASEEARFGQAFLNVGLVPDLGSMYFLPRTVGMHKAKELIFTGKTVVASEAYEMGLVNRVLPAEELLPAAISLATQLAAGPSKAMAMVKRTLNRSREMNLESVLELEAYAQGLCFTTPDHREGVDAFINKRKPNFPRD